MMKKNPVPVFIFLILFNIYPLNAQPVWQSNGFRFFLQNNILSIYKNDLNVIEIHSFEFNFIRPESVTVEKVKEDGLYLKLKFNENDGYHSDFPGEITLTISQFNNTIHFFTSHKAFNHITVKIKDDNEHYFGLIEKLYPGNSPNPDLRGNIIDVDVYSLGEKNYAENYASAYSAFFMSSKGYGSFYDTFARGEYKLAVNGLTEIYHQTGTLNWYLFYGPTGEKIHAEYYSVIGKPKYIPVWACGPIFWRDQNFGGKEEVLSDIQKFTEMKIPLTACFIDRPYSSGKHEWSVMNFNEKFSEPEKWIKTINEKYGMEVMTWVGPMTFSDTDFPGLLCGDYTYIDLTNPEAVKEFERRLNKYQYSAGVRGHKMDRADEHFPYTAKWFEPVEESESRNKYVYLYSKVIDEFLSKAWGRNNFNFARAAFHRTQPFLSALWGGDSRNNWRGMAGNMANAIRCGFMGFPVWGSDTGGYLGQGRIDEIMYIRWLQWSAWCGLFEVKIDGAGGQGEDRPPWKYSGDLQNAFRDAAELRMNLLPYIYSCANTTPENGVLMKPLAYLFPGDEKTYNIWDEYIFGSSFLIAPLFSADSKRDVYLPAGKWYDYYNLNNVYEGPVTIMREVSLKNIPVFIKENSIYVTGSICHGNSKIWNDVLEENEKITVHLFHLDEGTEVKFTYIDYHDNDIEKRMKSVSEKNRILFTSDKLSSDSEIEIKCNIKPAKILLNDKEVNFDYNTEYNLALVKIEKNTPVNLEILK